MPDDTKFATVERKQPGLLVKWLPAHYQQPVTPYLLAISIPSAIAGMLIAWQMIAAGKRAGALAGGILTGAAVGLFYVHTFLHELGHLLMAIMVGFRLHKVKLGPLVLTFSDGKIHCRADRSLAGPPAYVAATPTDGRASRMRMMAFIGGGPLASLTAGILSLLLASAFNQPGPTFSSYPPPSGSGKYAFFFPQNLTSACLNVSAVIGIALALTTLIPGSTLGFLSDGGQLLDLLRGGGRAEGNHLQAILAGSMAKGTRPRGWDPALIERLLALRKGSPEDSLWNLYCYYYAMDCGQIDRADQYLGLALSQREGYPIESRAALFLEGAYFDARFRSDLLAAAFWHAESKEGHAEEQAHCRAEAAIFWAMGKLAEAMARAEAGLRAIPQSRDLGGRIAEQEWLEELLQLCRKGIAGGSEPEK